MRQYFVGIDVSKGRHTAAAVDEDDQIRFKDVEFTDDGPGYERLLQAVAGLPERGTVRVCLEATGNYGRRLACFLWGQPGFVVSVINARQSHHFAVVLMQRAKTDRVDAVLLARYARAMRPRGMEAPAEAREALARLTRTRESMDKGLQAQVNLLRSLLETLNPAVEREFRDVACDSALAVLERYPTGAMLARARLQTLADIKAGSRRLGQVRGERLRQAAQGIPGAQGADSDAALVREVVQLIGHLKRSIAALEQRIAQQVHGHVLFSIPGMGPATIPVVLAELPVQHLDSDRQAVAFAGLNPRVRTSGRWAGKVKLSKWGPPQLRRALYMAVLAGLHTNPVLQAYYNRKLADGKKPKAAIVACMTKLLRIIFAMLKTGRAFDPHYEAKRPARPRLTLQVA